MGYGYKPTSFPNGTNVKIGICGGGTAGDHTLVGGIEENDAIMHVLRVTLVQGDSTGANVTFSSAADLTSEFTDPCASDDTISNSGGTNTTNTLLVCLFADADAGESSL